MAPAGKAEAISYGLFCCGSTVVYCANHYTAIPTVAIVLVFDTDADVAILGTANIRPVTTAVADRVCDCLSQGFRIISSYPSANRFRGIGLIVAITFIQTGKRGIDPPAILIVGKSGSFVCGAVGEVGLPDTVPLGTFQKAPCKGLNGTD